MENKSVRDTMFRHYFNGGHGSGIPNMRLLSLVNAIQGADHTDLNLLKINTLDGSFFSSLKNDVSCTLNGIYLMLIEHQSTINDNMPVRFLSYADELFKLHLQPFHEKIYKSRLIHLPTPEFHVFYDGEDTSFDHKILRLSDAFIAPGRNLELIVHCHNLNPGKSQKLKALCKPLDDYSKFSNKFKEYRKEKNSINDSVRMTIDYCRKNGIMTDYLTDNESEVINMFGFEWNEEEERKALIELGEERGEQRGITIGEKRGEKRSTINSIRNLMKNMHWSAEEAMEAIGIEQSQYKQYLALL